VNGVKNIYGTIMVCCPGFVICITPPHMHISFEVLFKAGILAISTVGQPGAHGAVVAGIHGIGVKTPIAAAVADATIGLAMELHMPKGNMFTIGLLSIIFASGMDVKVLFIGRTMRLPGAAPKLH